MVFQFWATWPAKVLHAPFDQLRQLLRHGLVVLGPLEFAKLVYNPVHIGSTDSDH